MATVIGTDTTKVLRATCWECASIVEYTPSETRKDSRRDYTGSSDTYVYLKCPKCAHDICVG